MSAAVFDSTSRADAPVRSSRASIWTGRVLSGIAVAFLIFDAGIKLSGAKEAAEGTTQLGWQPHHLPILAAIQVVCLVVYLIPRTAPLGAVLWTGYLGGAIATHLRLDNPLFTHILFPIYVAALLWGGLYLRDPRVRNAIRPIR